MTITRDSQQLERLFGGESDLQSDWQSLDAIKPTFAMSPLQAYSHLPLTVNWAGGDTGVSGFRQYDIQYKDGAAGAWTNWLSATTLTS